MNKIDSLSFKALDFKYVSAKDRQIFIRKDFKDLQELGKKYDIRLVSVYDMNPDFEAIDIEVRPLKDGLNFFKKLFRPTGRRTFKTGYVTFDETAPSITHYVKDAIADLLNKIHK